MVEGVSDDFDRNHPICLGGEGNAPPEDVGGEPGYEHFLATINDKDHPDFSELQHWGSIQGYREFNMENVNRRLRSV
ncbi:hypothetical protein J7W16_03415 [Bacillus sp. YZJH907-2]|uniref:Plasmid pRiA4b Orf3-like domain-containing protein n=1 Tax=Halalkalibacter suaedae TaxID=2822140 RepID=A0A940WQX5_9BACI|nr:hypothetical protein [Bacillus suaedae]